MTLSSKLGYLAIAFAVLFLNGCGPRILATYGPTKTVFATGLASTRDEIAVSDARGRVHIYHDSEWRELKNLPFISRVWDAGRFILLETDKREVFYGTQLEEKLESFVVHGTIVSAGPCGDGFYALTNGMFYIFREGRIVSRNWARLRPKDAECHGSGIYLATEGRGVAWCPFAGDRCDRATDVPLHSKHVHSLRYVPALNSFLLAIRGDYQESLVYKNGSLLPAPAEAEAGNQAEANLPAQVLLPSALWLENGEDALACTDDSSASTTVQAEESFSRERIEVDFLSRVERLTYPLAISTKGDLYRYEGSSYVPTAIRGLNSLGIVEHDGRLVGFVNKKLSYVDIENESARPLAPQPALADTDLVSSTFVEDFATTENDALFAATNDVGVWASVDHGEHWFPFNDGLPEINKVHFVEYSDSLGRLVVGEHFSGLYMCELPCQKWLHFTDEVLEPEPPGTLLDPQDAIQSTDSSFLVATEAGLFSLLPHGAVRIDRTEPPLDFFRFGTDRGGRTFVGIYFKEGRAGGVWEVLPTGIRHILEGFDVPIRGLAFLNEDLLVATVDSLSRCAQGACASLIIDVPINGIEVVDETIWIAAEVGFGFVAADLLSEAPLRQSDITWISDIPAETIEHMPPEIFVGTRGRGIVRLSI